MPDSAVSFPELGLPKDLCAAVKELGYETPTPVQVKSVPILLGGGDLIGQAQTGTGKTAAFALPILGRLDSSLREPQALILTPTRELAIQVAEAFQSYARQRKNFHVLPIYGGQSIGLQLRQLQRKPQVIVGTPGRVMDHLRRKSLSLSSIKMLVMDEADEMLSMGFIEDIEWILEQSPAEKQTALFSATMPKPIRAIAQKYLKDPAEVVIEQVRSSEQLISQSHWVVSGVHKLDALTRILETSEIDGVLIFMRTKTATLELAEKLEARGYSAGALNGDMSQDARERTVEKFKRGQLDVLVATDVAARGLHIDRISHVINYDAPFDLQTYTHRIGRTGRAGRSGTAILFTAPREMGLLRSLERGTGRKIPALRMPTKEDLGKRRIEKFIHKVQDTLTHIDLAPYDGIVATLTERIGIPPDTLAKALCAVVNAETPLLVEGRDIVQEAPSDPEKRRWRGDRGKSLRKRFKGGKGPRRGGRK